MPGADFVQKAVHTVETGHIRVWVKRALAVAVIAICKNSRCAGSRPLGSRMNAFSTAIATGTKMLSIPSKELAITAKRRCSFLNRCSKARDFFVPCPSSLRFTNGSSGS